MANELFQCEVLTPDGRVFGGKVGSAVIPAHDGLMGVLAHHAPMVCALGYGLLRLQTEAGEETWFIEGGFAHILPDRTAILTPSAVRPDQLNEDDARALLDEARQVETADDVGARRKAGLEANARARLRLCRQSSPIKSPS